MDRVLKGLIIAVIIATVLSGIFIVHYEMRGMLL